MGRNGIFKADMSSSLHIDNKDKGIFLFSKGPIQRLDDTPLAAAAKYRSNITQPNKRFVLSLHCNGSDSFLLVNTTKMYKFKAKHSEIRDYALW